ncbi:unnamed protein product [Hymenolepis diminuta]|uniref:DNA replication complex GINS protein SLD5 n=1 Tax=Hymenolepis diminuta TaxID=6216 RepID=A0A3P6ZYY7_HYMDI|nr:unnamed protein product [Hymenolepis diminuta]
MEDIIGGSDEENEELFGPIGQQRDGDAAESVTLPELIKRFKKIWQNEKLSPELMTAQTGIISLIVNELTEFEQQINSQPRGELKTQLMKLQIEQYPHYVIMEERARSQAEEPHLSPAEFNFAKIFDNATLNSLRSCVLEHLPVNMRKLDPDAIALRPNLDSSNLPTNTLTLMPREIHLLPYRVIRQHTEDGSVILL